MGESVQPRVTIAIPVYKRLDYLEGALESVARQDYPEIDLLISDNGIQGSRLEELVDRCLARPYRLRANPQTVSITEHYNQLIDAAEGDYFVLLCDDDELGGTDYISTLVEVLETQSDVGVALGKLEAMDASGAHAPRPGEDDLAPCVMTGSEFVRIWSRNEYDFVCFVTNLARTADIRRVGGYPVFPKGTAVDNALLLQLTLGRKLAFVPKAVFRSRQYEESHGLALSDRDLAADLRAFLRFVDRDPTLQAYAASDADGWREVRPALIETTWRTYRHRWKNLYRRRLGPARWLRAAIRMPWVAAYYRSVLWTVVRRGVHGFKNRLRGTEAGGR
jgi:glycosyltransferase involved in cell wall biosynthesis